MKQRSGDWTKDRKKYLENDPDKIIKSIMERRKKVPAPLMRFPVFLLKRFFYYFLFKFSFQIVPLYLEGGGGYPVPGKTGGRGTPPHILERGRGYPPVMLKDRPPPPARNGRGNRAIR